MSTPILLVEDDERLAELVVTYLSSRGFDVEHQATGEGALAALGSHHALVLLDVMLPDADGFDLCKSIRAGRNHANVPIIMITARGEAMDRIIGLELGADDYLPKPFNPRELLARMKAVLRRQNPEPAEADVRTYGRLTIDEGRRQALLDGTPCRLTAHQFDILRALTGQQGRVLSRDQLMHAVRHTALEAFDRSIDVHVSRIRHAIEDDPKHPKRIQTVRGAGYVFARHQD